MAKLQNNTDHLLDVDRYVSNQSNHRRFLQIAAVLGGIWLLTHFCKLIFDSFLVFTSSLWVITLLTTPLLLMVALLEYLRWKLRPEWKLRVQQLHWYGTVIPLIFIIPTSTIHYLIPSAWHHGYVRAGGLRSILGLMLENMNVLLTLACGLLLSAQVILLYQIGHNLLVTEKK